MAREESRARLEVVDGAAEPRVLLLATTDLERGVLIGRGSEADVRLLDERASRRHARVYLHEGRPAIEDLGSANGTALNGEDVSRPAALFDGDRIDLGGVSLRYLRPEDAERETVIQDGSARLRATLAPEEADPSREGASEAIVRRLRLVCRGAGLLAEAATPSEVAQTAATLLGEAFPGCGCSVALCQGETIQPMAVHPPHHDLTVSDGVRRRVLEEGEAIWLDALAGGKTHSGDEAEDAGSLLVAPLRAGGAAVGLLAVSSPDIGRFSAADLEAVAAVAHQAALSLRTVRAVTSARAASARLASERSGGVPELLGESPAMSEVRDAIARAAASEAAVLIAGETGTGKELAARHLHAQSPRHLQPFVALNCAALVEGLLESELFGHERGAFTGAVDRREGLIATAGTGTLFLDEIGELSPALQAKLLRVLAERTYATVGGRTTLPMRCRLVSATNRELEAEIRGGGFRQDLYFRLAVVVLRMPPLRERPEDIGLLARSAIERLAARMGRRVPRLSEDALALLESHVWPGNVRELENALERALVLLDGEVLGPESLPLEVRRAQTSDAGGGGAEVLTLREAEQRAVAAALRRTNGKKGAAAALLGISWPTLNRKIREYGIEVPSDR